MKKQRLVFCSTNRMNAICGLVLPVAIPRKSLSVKEKVASGFPWYGPAHQKQIFQNTDLGSQNSGRRTREKEGPLVTSPFLRSTTKISSSTPSFCTAQEYRIRKGVDLAGVSRNLGLVKEERFTGDLRGGEGMLTLGAMLSW